MCRTVSPLILILLLLNGGCSRNARSYLARANSLAAQGKDSEAALNYRKVIQLDANNGEAYYQLGSVLLKMRKPQEAYGALSRAAELLPTRDDVSVKLVDLLMSIFIADSHRPRAVYDKLTSLSDGLLARNSASYDGLRLKAGLAAVDRKYKESAELFQKANLVRPMQPELITGWAEVLIADNRHEEAEIMAFQLIAKNKSYGPIYDVLYRYYLQANRRADAEKILQTRLRNNPTDAEGILQLAGFYGIASREGDMKTALERMLNNPKTFPQAHLQVGNLYSRMRRWNDALDQYEQGATGDPKDKTLYQKRIADVLVAEGKGDQAGKVVSEILKEQPEDESAQGVQASLLLASGKPENVVKAVSILQALVDKNPNDANWHFNLGRGLAAKGDLDGARVQFQQAIAQRRDLLPPRLALLELSQARGDYKTSLQDADQILALYPNLTRVKLARAVSLMYTGSDVEARRDLTSIAQAAPKDREAPLQLAVLDFRQKKFKDAEDHFSTLVREQKGDNRALSGLVQTLIAENQADKAFSVLQEQLRKSPDSIPVHSILAKTAVETGRYDLAIGQYQQMLAAAPNSEQTCMALGTVYRLKGDFPSAISYLQKARGLAPNDPQPMMVLGGVLAATGRKPEALDSFRKALKLKPDDASALNNASYLIAETGGSLDEALNFAQRAVHTDSNQPNYADTLGWIYLKKKMNDSAAQVFRGLTEKYPDNATFHYHFGMALLQKGDKAAANAELKTALSKAPPGEVRNNIQTALAGIG